MLEMLKRLDEDAEGEDDEDDDSEDEEGEGNTSLAKRLAGLKIGKLSDVFYAPITAHLFRNRKTTLTPRRFGICFLKKNAPSFLSFLMTLQVPESKRF